MTKALPFTQLAITRAVAAARKSGLRVTGITATGVVLTAEGDAPPLDNQNNLERSDAPSKWGDIQT